MTNTLQALADRVEAGSGADRALDLEIATALNWHHPVKADRWTSSLDAVVALIEERLPGWWWNVTNLPSAVIGTHETADKIVRFVSSAPNSSPARSLLAATLRALAAQQQDRPKQGARDLIRALPLAWVASLPPAAEVASPAAGWRVPDGWKLVPVDPTEAMVDAAVERGDDEPLTDWGNIRPAAHAEIFKAMLAAAPSPPPAEGG